MIIKKKNFIYSGHHNGETLNTIKETPFIEKLDAHHSKNNHILD